MSIQQMSQAHNESGSLPANARLESMVNPKSADFSQRMNTYFKKTNTYFIRFFLFKPTNHNLQSMTVKKVWNTKYLTLMRADSGRAVMRARSQLAYARRLLARMHSWPPARKSWARCKLQTHQPQLTEYDCEETLEHKVSYTHARRFGTRCHERKVTARICA